MKLFLCILLIALASAHEPKDHFDYTKCCKLDKSPATAQYVENMMKLADECKPELGQSEKGKPPRFACFNECLGNKTNIINADKSLNEENYRSFVTTQMVTEDYVKSAADEIVTKCIEKIKAADNSGDSPDGCSKTALKAFHCVSKDIINACPADKQDPDEHCVRLREFINGDFKGKAT